MVSTMRAEPTPEQLQAALHRIRALPHCAAWPANVAEVQRDPLRARLLRLMAICGFRRAPPFDFKRAAAGERDEQNPFSQEHTAQ